ncbi:hypothetical protein PtB15_5B280 [Puccinia triticina]|nr:hypothetical protein PtB15_5B280 [Puccinia triticina]
MSHSTPHPPFNPAAMAGQPPGRFQAKNLVYLRISRRCVLMTKILVDPPHLGWFEANARAILAKLIEILKPRVLTKLHDETHSTARKSKLDIYRGSGFQFGYYFRNLSYQHSILLKSRETIHPIETERQKDDPEQLEEEDTKPSCALKVHYEPFSIFGKSLMVIIEPFPLAGPSQTENPPPSAADARPKPKHPRAQPTRPGKPLFVPEDEDGETLEDISLDLNQPHQTLLSQLIKDPTSDRQLDPKAYTEVASLDGILAKVDTMPAYAGVWRRASRKPAESSHSPVPSLA